MSLREGAVSGRSRTVKTASSLRMRAPAAIGRVAMVPVPQPGKSFRVIRGSLWRPLDPPMDPEVLRSSCGASLWLPGRMGASGWRSSPSSAKRSSLICRSRRCGLMGREVLRPSGRWRSCSFAALWTLKHLHLLSREINNGIMHFPLLNGAGHSAVKGISYRCWRTRVWPGLSFNPCKSEVDGNLHRRLEDVARHVVISWKGLLEPVV